MITNGQMNAEQTGNTLRWKLDDTEPCRLAVLGLNKNNDVEKWVGAWTNSTSPEVAAELCAGCHVLELCGEYAIVAEEMSFIYGGMTPQQRKDIIAGRRRAKKAHARLNDRAYNTDKAA